MHCAYGLSFIYSTFEIIPEDEVTYTHKHDSVHMFHLVSLPVPLFSFPKFPLSTFTKISQSVCNNLSKQKKSSLIFYKRNECVDVEQTV